MNIRLNKGLRRPVPVGIIIPLGVAAVMLGQITPSAAQSTADCLMCHEDMSLLNEDGKSVGVSAQLFAQSVHSALSCVDCHNQLARWEDIPHFDGYHRVNCADCHSEAVVSFRGSFHGTALAKASPNAPNCVVCHSPSGDPHGIQPLDIRSAENACRRCHQSETRNYDGSVHAVAAQKGGKSPGCVSCHPTHSAALPPSVGAVNRLCESCHSGAMQQVTSGAHALAEIKLGGPMACSSCHDVHATHKPHLDRGTIQACQACHPGYKEKFIGSVHQPLLKQDKINCLSCHRTHQISDISEGEQFGCGACHQAVEGEYRASAHRLARLKGDRIAARCADCHDGHHILRASDPRSPVHRTEIPVTCGKCHGDQSVVTADFVRLPISLPGYSMSVHGSDPSDKHKAAVCTDCHGTHLLQSASAPSSMINKQNLAATCGQCHTEESREYANSIHGRAVALGIMDSPSCTDCHDEHLILHTTDPRSAVNRVNLASETCGRCHEDPEMSSRYGLPPDVIESYMDSYHGWAVKRGGKAVAVCTDCHNTHAIHAAADPVSSIHKNNVVQTCGRCHPNSNAQFAASYTHILARNRLMAHDYVRIIYIWFIAIVLGGMAAHNAVIFIRELKIHFARHRREPAIRRLTTSEIVQHIILAATFFGLALTGFALRFPEAWWAKLMVSVGLTEESRRIIHRTLAVMLTTASVYHIFYLMFTNRGRILLRALFPRWQDVKDAIANIRWHLRPDGHPPRYGMFDYTQKAEYWALIWGTTIMGITGLVLWFPAIATSWLPAWVVRLCEVVHFYEAILAVSAIFIWHFFYEIFLPREYPMAWSCVTGRMPKKDWEEHHSREVAETGRMPEELPPLDEG